MGLASKLQAGAGVPPQNNMQQPPMMSQGYPPSQQFGQGYPPQQNQFGQPPTIGQGYPPQQQSIHGYPPPMMGQGYPPQNQPPSMMGQGYSPQQQSGQGYPPQNQNLPNGQGYPPQQPFGQGYPPQQPLGQGYPPQNHNLPLNHGYPPQPGSQPPFNPNQGGVQPPFKQQQVPPVSQPPFNPQQGFQPPFNPQQGTPGSQPPFNPQQGQLPYNLYGNTPQNYGPGPNASALSMKLQQTIQNNKLETFYNPQQLQQCVQKASQINFGEIARQFHISTELAYDFVSLSLYDIVFFCDDSGSMAFEENGERIEDLKVILSKVADVATKFDDDGISVRFMNGSTQADGLRSAADVQRLFTSVTFNGTTPLGTQLDAKVLQPVIVQRANSGSLGKPVLVIVITDGEPSGEPRDALVRKIAGAKDACSRTRYGPGSFAIEIAQVGKDSGAQRFLGSLDNDPTIGGMVDCTSYYELEADEYMRKGVTLTPELWILKLCVGAIDRSYDDQD